ncbi:MAG: hypothetical protein GY725_13345 [bacterium]|nr:hypothetical protein [bacterium]
MIDRVREFMALLDERSSRERFMICLTLLATVFVVWNSFLMNPLEQRKSDAAEKLEANKETVARLEEEAAAIESKLKLDPNELNRVAKTNLEREIRRADEEISDETADLIPPNEMVQALRALLDGRKDLELVRMEALTPAPLYSRSEKTKKAVDVQAQVWLHSVELEFEGSYLSALRYVRAIESMEWNLLWDRLEYTVIEYPRGRISLRVQSVSTEEGWIGA